MERVYEAYFLEGALEKAMRHAQQAEKEGKEAMGLLSGEVREWQGSRYVVVSDYLTAGNSATSVRVKFSQEAFPQLARQVNAARKDGKIVVGWSHCLPPEELVMTDKGPKTAQEIFSAIKLGVKVKVPSLDLPSRKLVFSHITRAAEHKTNRLIRIEAALNRNISATREHRLLTLDRRGMAWKKTNEITTGDYLAIPTKIPGVKTEKFNNEGIIIKRPASLKYFPKVPERNSPQLMKLLGLLYSDGHIRPRAWIEFSNRDKRLLEEFSRLCVKVFGIKPIIDYKNYRARLFSRIVYLFLEQTIGYSKHNLPPVVFTSTHEEISAFIEGLMAGDGYTALVSARKKEKTNAIYLGENRRLSDELVYLYALLGVKARVREQKQNFAIRNHDYIYAVVVQEKPTQHSDVLPFGGELVRDLCRRKRIKVQPHFALRDKAGATRQTLTRVIKKLKQNRVSDPAIGLLEELVRLPLSWVKVKRKKETKRNCKVYDFFVEKTNTFIGGSGPIISHNSHPDYGCFLSGTDVQTQRRYFGEEFNIAAVVDPVRNEKKVFKLDGNPSGYREASYAVIRKRK